MNTPLPPPAGALSAAALAAFRSLAHGGSLRVDPLDARAQEENDPILCGEAGHENTGTRVRFELLLRGGRIAAARFLAYGCPHTLAACEWLAQRLEGQSVEDIIIGNPMDWADNLEIPQHKLGRLLTVEDALRTALRLPPKAA